ncbi:MAG: hypothetical protein ABIQ74_06915 [Chitinophagales bacterium]
MRKIVLFFFILTSVIFVQKKSTAQEWKDVAPIIYNNCSSCHRPEEIGPFPLLSYHDASDPNQLYNIQAYVNEGLMPPWKADPEYTHFLDERVLSQGEKDLISSWVDAGAPAGDTTLAPPPPTFPAGSQLGVPDLILSMSQSYTTPGDNADHYMCFVLPTDLIQATDVAAIEFRPGNGTAVHHTFIYLCNDSSAYYHDVQTPEYGYEVFGGVGNGVSAEFITLYGPGMIPRFYPAGGAVNFPAGSFLIIQVHYAPTTLQLEDSSSINLFYSANGNIRNVIAKRIGEGNITNPPFIIEADMVDTFYSEFEVANAYSLFAIAPHQHLLGKSYKIYAVDAAQDTIPLISIPEWDFHWQLLYSYPFMIKLDTGVVIHAFAVYDNTTNNPDNPSNPPVNVHYGENSTDEMFKYFINMLNYLPGDESIIIDSTWGIPTIVPPLNGIVATPQLYQCSPNPASDQLAITYFLPFADYVQLFIYDASGKVVSESYAPGDPGFRRVMVDVSKFPPGPYVFSLHCKGKLMNKSFIVQ